MLDKESAINEIKRLVEKYNREKDKKYNEEATKNDFILPLFKILGWDVEDSNEVSKEENISGKRVDYGFRIDGIPKFFLEAKSFEEGLDGSRIVKGRKVTYAEQAINYAYYKGCNWAILINFKEIRVYDAWAKANTASFRFGLRIDTLLNDFDNSLYLLSKDAFEKGELDKRYSTKSRKRPITEQLLTDFTTFRGMLSKDVYNLNKSKNLTEEELDEAVQRLFDRLIFIRNCEDRELEPYDLLSALRQWKESKKGTLVSKVRGVFKYFDETYDSKIFDLHLCDQVNISDDVLSDVITGLYTTEDGSIFYDFSLIDADVLGNIYEQYLGHILSKTKERTKLTESKTKRKSEGIYYTPSYIVDYIVRNTVGDMIKKRKTDVSKIKVLDPACGSGSFLIKTFDVLDEYYSKKEGYKQNKLDISGVGTTYSTKLSILKDNIFGVDLDKQAVDIAQLNLLLKVAEKKRRLPILQKNIKNGNSLIDDPNLVGDKAFKWEKEFEEIMNNGGFDAIVGNPPYVRVQNLKYSEIDYFKNNYSSAFQRTDIYLMFYEKALKLLNVGGRIGFISSIQFINSEYGRGLRKLLLNNRIIEIIDFGDLPVFSDAVNYTGIFIIEKGKPKDFVYTKIESLDNIELQIKTTKREMIAVNKLSENIWVLESNRLKTILEKVHNNPKLADIALINTGCFTGEDEAYFVDDETIKKENLEQDIIKPVILGKEPKRYILLNPKRKAIYPYRLVNNKTEIIDEHDLEKNYPNILNHLKRYKKDLLTRKDSRVSFSESGKVWYSYTRKGLLDVFDRKKLIVGYITNTNNFCIDEQHYIFGVGRAFGIVLNSEEFDLNYLLGVLCSKLYYFLMKKECPIKKGGFFKISSDYLNNLPVRKVSLEEQKSVSKLVKSIMPLKFKLNELKDKQTDEKSKVEIDVKKIEDEINQLVYKIYKITEEEKKVIEKAIS